MRIFPGLGRAAEKLDPGTRMGEILFGLIMTLTFTLGAGLALEQEGPDGARALLIATIGCNVAWGLIDGVFYVLGRVFERGRRSRVAARVRDAASAADAERRVAEELDDALEPLADEPARRALYAAVARHLATDAASPGARVTRDDLVGGFWAGWLVFACSFPAAVPFFFIDEPRVALRISNLLLIVLLAVVGYRAGREAYARPWVGAATFVVAGVLLVGAAIALGG